MGPKEGFTIDLNRIALTTGVTINVIKKIALKNCIPLNLSVIRSAAAYAMGTDNPTFPAT